MRLPERQISEPNFSVQEVYKTCPRDQPLSKGYKGGRNGQRDAGTMTPSTHPMGNFGATVAFQSCPQLGWDGQAFIVLNCLVIRCGSPWEKSMTCGIVLYAADIVPGTAVEDLSAMSQWSAQGHLDQDKN